MSRKLELNGIINALNKINLPRPTRRYEQFKLAIHPRIYYSMKGVAPSDATVSTITLIADYEKNNYRVLSWHVLME